MRQRLRGGVTVAFLSISFFYAARQAGSWMTQQPSDYHAYLRHLDEELPRDARILLFVPDSERDGSDVYTFNTYLYPRITYLPPKGVRTMEEAKDWIRQKRLTWAVSLGGRPFDPGRAFIQRLDGGR
jgi:hypothetical protein